MVVIEIDPIWNDELGLGPPSSLKITLKGGWTSVCLVQVVKSPSPIPSWESCWPGKYWATPQLLPFFFFFLYFHSLLMEQGRLLKMSPCPKRTSRSQKVGVYLPISLSVVLFQIHLKPYCCIPSCQRQAHNLSFSKLWERQLLPLLLEQIGPSAHGRAVREWDARILFREISGFLTRGL